jgi:EmrB/QacA subfamily drug resistance transporter
MREVPGVLLACQSHSQTVTFLAMPNKSQTVPPMPVALPASAPPRTAARPGAVLGVLSLAAFLASLDLFIVNVAFNAIGRDFHRASFSNLSWILNGYAIIYAALLVPLGRLADRYGRKAGFIGGLALFTAASAACAASPGLWWLVSFRVLQAVGAAALTPASLGLLLAATPADRRVRAVRIWAASGALAAAAGPVFGGLLVGTSWRWVFLVNVPVGVAALVATYRIVPGSRDDTVTARPDLSGAGLLTIAIGALALGLVKGSDWGWTSAGVVASFVVSVAGLALFWWRSLHHNSPIVEPALLKVRAFAWSNATSLLFSIGFGSGLLANVLWVQGTWHYSALRTGFAVAPGPLMVPVFSLLAQKFAQRIPPGRIAALGCLVYAAGTVLVSFRLGEHPAYAAELLPSWLLTGAGVGLALPTILSTATADLPPTRAATGSAVVNMSRQIGLVLGISVLVAVLGTHVSYAATHDAFRHAYWFIAGAELVAAVTALGMSPRLRPQLASPKRS